MARRPTHEPPEAEEQVILLLFQPPTPPDERSDGLEAGRLPSGWRRCWTSFRPIALHLTLLLLLGAGLAAQTVIFAETDGLAEKFAWTIDYLGWIGGLLVFCGLVWAGMFLRDQEEDWARPEISIGVAAAAAGLALFGAAQLISDLSASGAIPIP